MKEFEKLREDLKRYEKMYTANLRSTLENKCGSSFDIPVEEQEEECGCGEECGCNDCKEKYSEETVSEANRNQEGDDLFTAIIADDKFTVKHIDPILKTSRKSKIQSWIKIAELGAKQFAKKVKLGDDWELLFPKEIIKYTAQQLMSHF